jgi:hypothetical protein
MTRIINCKSGHQERESLTPKLLVQPITLPLIVPALLLFNGSEVINDGILEPRLSDVFARGGLLQVEAAVLVSLHLLLSETVERTEHFTLSRDDCSHEDHTNGHKNGQTSKHFIFDNRPKIIIREMN